MSVEVELLTRPGCHLCEEMKGALHQAARGIDVTLVETNIDDDEALAAQYGDDIPVLFVDGSKAFKHRASVSALRMRLLKAAKKALH